MNDNKIAYRCVLPTNGHQEGDVVLLTADEAQNFNAGEEKPRFVLADESATDAPTETPAEEAAPAAPAATEPTSTEGTGSYEAEPTESNPSEETPAEEAAPESTPEESEEGVE
jgi:hypothetical protein